MITNCPMCNTVYDRPHECVGIETNVYERRIWNAAIEAAAKFVHPDNLNRMKKELKK